jgi:TatD DNase family protein
MGIGRPRAHRAQPRGAGGLILLVLIDTHLHLDAAEFDADRAARLAEARDAGVGAFVVPAVDRAGFAAILALAAREADVFPALGIHPLRVDAASAADLDLLDELLGRGNCVAVGEIGLDRHVGVPERALQWKFFTAQLGLARAHRLPVVLHTRRAVDETLAALRKARVGGGIAHAFNGSFQQARAFIDLGFKLGFGGAMSFAGSTRIRRLAAELPLETIVLETDAPDMAPAWARGERNNPANVRRYAAILAELRGMEAEEVSRATSANARAVLALPARCG